jgi:hypothetical protein
LAQLEAVKTAIEAKHPGRFDVVLAGKTIRIKLKPKDDL